MSAKKIPTGDPPPWRFGSSTATDRPPCEQTSPMRPATTSRRAGGEAPHGGTRQQGSVMSSKKILEFIKKAVFVAGKSSNRQTKKCRPERFPWEIPCGGSGAPPPRAGAGRHVSRHPPCAQPQRVVEPQGRRPTEVPDSRGHLCRRKRFLNSSKRQCL